MRRLQAISDKVPEAEKIKLDTVIDRFRNNFGIRGMKLCIIYILSLLSVVPFAAQKVTTVFKVIGCTFLNRFNVSKYSVKS